jgi:hypothetical protein
LSVLALCFCLHSFILVVVLFVPLLVFFFVLLRGQRADAGFSLLALKRDFTVWVKTYNYGGYFFNVCCFVFLFL